MNQEQFRREIGKARTLGSTCRDPERAAYWKGYVRGLSWASGGGVFRSGGGAGPSPLKADTRNRRIPEEGRAGATTGGQSEPGELGVAARWGAVSVRPAGGEAGGGRSETRGEGGELRSGLGPRRGGPVRGEGGGRGELPARLVGGEVGGAGPEAGGGEGGAFQTGPEGGEARAGRSGGGGGRGVGLSPASRGRGEGPG